MSPDEEVEWPRDPLLRALRAISIIAFLALLTILIVFKPEHDATTVGFLVGAIIIQLSYDALVGVPGIITHRGDQTPKDRTTDS